MKIFTIIVRSIALIVVSSACVAEVQKQQVVESTAQFHSLTTVLVKPGEPETRFEQVVGIMLNGDFHCTGTLIFRRTILTAAHCVWDKSQDDLEIRVGETVWDPVDRNKYGVTDYVVYSGDTRREQYDPHVDAHDIALIFTDRDLEKYNSRDLQAPLSIHTC